jgi:hypothetical protein
MIGVFVLAGMVGALMAYRFWLPRYSDSRSNSLEPIVRWFDDPSSRPELSTNMGGRTCPGAPFSLPSDGFIGMLWDDPAAPYTILNTHTGIDIFGDGAPGTVPVYAVYSGRLTRRPEWIASVIVRHDDPLQPGRFIWTYYTHMASRDGTRSFIAPDFPPDTVDMPVEQGTLLGYQGEFAGAGAAPIGMHVHMSIVQSEADGSFKNEGYIGNTLDPSPYFGMTLNIKDLPPRPIRCSS